MNLIAEGPAQFQLRLGVTLTSGAPVIRLMTLTWAVLLGLYVGVGRAQTPSAAQDAVTAPKCGLPASAESRGALDLREKSLLYDEFKSTTLGPEYEIRDGPGFFELVGSEEISSRAGLGRVLRYYALPRGVQFSAETELINIETLGRPYVPSLLVGRPFRGETWTFDSKIAFGFQQASNGRAIHLWIAFGDLTERSMNSVKITRYNDNPGRPQERGSLGVGIYSSGKQVGSKPILLNPEDTYFFCVRRAGRLVQVLVSSDGTKYAPGLGSHLWAGNRSENAVDHREWHGLRAGRPCRPGVPIRAGSSYVSSSPVTVDTHDLTEIRPTETAAQCRRGRNHPSAERWTRHRRGACKFEWYSRSRGAANGGRTQPHNV